LNHFTVPVVRIAVLLNNIDVVGVRTYRTCRRQCSRGACRRASK
jgi:hypothetical protein